MLVKRGSRLAQSHSHKGADHAGSHVGRSDGRGQTNTGINVPEDRYRPGAGDGIYRRFLSPVDDADVPTVPEVFRMLRVMMTSVMWEWDRHNIAP